MITGCGWNDTTARAGLRPDPVDERDDEVEAGFEGPLVAAEPLHVPARAWGTIRTERTTTSAREGDDGNGDQGFHGSLPRVHEGGRALDLDHVDGRAGGDHQRLVIGAGRPLLAADPHLPGLAGDLLHDPGLPPHQRRHPEPVLRPVAGPQLPLTSGRITTSPATDTAANTANCANGPNPSAATPPPPAPQPPATPARP